MAPKRKAAGRTDTTTRSTRNSTRSAKAESEVKVALKNSVAKDVTSKKEKISRVVDSADDEEDAILIEPPLKKARTSAKKSTASPKAKSTKATTSTTKNKKISPTLLDDELDSETAVGSSKGEPTSKPNKNKPQSGSTSSAAPATEAPYTSKRALALFTTYADEDDADVIGPEGFERLCTEGSIPLDGALPLILAWVVDAHEMARISKEEWMKASEELRIADLRALSMYLTDLEALLVLDKPPENPKKRGAQNGVYEQQKYQQCASDRKGSFSKLYMYCFGLAKTEQIRNIDMQTAIAFWSVLLTPRYPIVTNIIEFINDKGGYKGVNKDLWSMMLEFCQTVNPSLEDYETDGAWPTLFDDYVTWKKSGSGST